MSSVVKLKKYCPVCRSYNPTTFLSRKEVPVHQHLIFKSKEEAINTVKGNIEMAVCPECSFVYNRAFDESLLDYSGDYNNQVVSDYYDKHIDSLVSYLVDDLGVKDNFIFKAGCGDGSFIKRLIEEAPGNDGVGYDPCYVGPEEMFGGRLSFRRSFYPDEFSSMSAPSIIICRHLIEHIEYPVAFLGSIRKSLIIHPAGVRLFFETPCIEWTLDNNMPFDFFYEHCSLFSIESLTFALNKAGFIVRKSKHVFGGQYLWFEAEVRRGSIKNSQSVSISEMLKFKDGYNEKIKNLRGPVAVLGAAAKGVSFVNEVDPLCSTICCVIDDNETKQGGFIPGTGHPIVPFSAVLDYNIGTILVTNPNYVESVRAKANKINPDIRVVNILEEL